MDLSSIFHNERYRLLALSLVGLFGALLVILALNYYFVQQSTSATEHMDIIGDISDSALNIVADAQHLALHDDQDMELVSALVKESALMDEYFTSLEDYPKKEQAMDNMLTLWQQYKPKITSVTPEDKVAQHELALYAFEKQEQIWEYIDEAYEIYLEDSYRYTDYARYLQIFTLLMLIGYLVFFVRVAFARMIRADNVIYHYQRQTDDIMKTVNEGLFLVDNSLVISDKHSDRLTQILQKTSDEIAGHTLYELLDGMISPKDMEATELFVEQLYNPWVVEELIGDLNPLKKVTWAYMDENGVHQSKFLQFDFLRVIDDDEEIESVFVSVVDITNEIRLQHQMQKNKEQNDRQIEMISYLIGVDGGQFVNFLEQTKARLVQMNEVLKNTELSLAVKAQELYRQTHRLKGDASAVQLTALSSLAHAQETILKNLSKNPNLRGDDFLPFTAGLDEMMDLTIFIEELTTKLNLSAKPSETKTTTYFENYAKDIAIRQQKEIALEMVGLENFDVGCKNNQGHKDILIQLLRNAIVHGVESPSDRQTKGKPTAGKVLLEVENTDQYVRLRVKDDGAGINWDKIRQKAVQMGQVNPATAEMLSSFELMKLMFLPGMSTAEHADEDAGRGVGMDIIKELANEGKGKIAVNTRPNEFTEVTVTFPK